MLDSLNFQTVGCWPYGKPAKGGSPAFPPYCPVSESVLYVAAGRSMCVLDISSPAAVTKLDSFATPGCMRTWFSVSGDYCLTGQYKSGVALYDIRDRRHPALVSTYLTPWPALGGQLIGRYGFIVGDELRILDYADPHNPVEVGACVVPEMTDGVFVNGDYAYLAANYQGFVVIDIHDLSNPFEVYRYRIPPPPSRAARDIQVRDTVAYIAWEDAGLRIWNVKDPTAPFEIGVYPGSILSVSVVDTVVYAAHTRNYEYDSLHVISVADPSHPRLLSTYRGTCPTVLGSRCFLLNPWSNSRLRDDTLSILDVSDPQSPALLGIYSQFHAGTDGLFVQGNYAYAGTRGQGLKVYDVSDPSAPRLLSRLGSYLVNQAWVSPDHIAYMACWTGPVFRTADVTDPRYPVLLGTIDTTRHGQAVTVSDTLAFLSTESDVWVMNVADPRTPRRVGIIPGQSDDVPWHCGVAGNLLLVPYTYGDKYLKIFDTWDPTQPESLCFYDIGVAASDVAVRFPYAYVVGSQFIVLDISNPSEPHELARRPVTGYGQSIALDGNLAYVAESDWGVRAYDVSNPAEPVEAGFYVTPSFVNEVQVKDGLVYAADYDGWLVLEHHGGGIAERSGGTSADGRLLVNYLPASATLKVRLPQTGERLRSLEVFNVAGERVYATTGESLSGKTEAVISPIALAAGVHILVVRTARTSYTAKFVVVK